MTKKKNLNIKQTKANYKKYYNSTNNAKIAKLSTTLRHIIKVKCTL